MDRAVTVDHLVNLVNSIGTDGTFEEAMRILIRQRGRDKLPLGCMYRTNHIPL